MPKRLGEILSAKASTIQRRVTTKIIGAPPLRPAGEVKRLDRHSVTPSPEMEIVKHEELIIVQSHIRHKPKRKDEPDVRVRSMSKEGREAWQNAKKGKY